MAPGSKLRHLCVGSRDRPKQYGQLNEAVSQRGHAPKPQGESAYNPVQ
jgi:hypothetical protein